METAATNATIRSNVAQMHRVFVDRGISGQSPMQRAVSAVDYVLKSKGASLIKVNRDIQALPFFVVHGYDIAFSVTVITISVFVFILKVCHLCCGHFRR